MKYKIFIKTILTITLLNNSCALFAEYVRKDAPEETPKKDTPTPQGQMARPAPLIAPKQPSQAQSKQPTSSPQVTTKQPQIQSTAESRKLDSAVASVPDPLTVRDRAAAREAASEAEAERARYLPAAGLGLPTRVPTLVAPTMPAKPLGQGVALSTTSKPKSLTQPDAPEKETAEAIKKQTANLIERGLSASEADFLMRMAPADRAETIKKLEENQALKPAQPKPVVETQRPIAEPATTPKPITQPDKEAEEVTRKKTAALEQQETMKKQTADLKQMGLSDLDIDKIMKMPPQQRDETVKKLKEAQAKKPATQPATPSKTVAQTEQEFNGIQKELANLMARKGRNKSKMTPEKVNALRSEQRRVGKECRSRRSPYH